MSVNPTEPTDAPAPNGSTLPEATDVDLDAEKAAAEASAQEARDKRHQHEDEQVDEWEEESFPASDPPSNY